MNLFPKEAIVLAGGAGTRLRDVLPDIPKVLAPVGGRPFLHRLLEHLAQQGIERVVLATGYAAEAVEAAAEACRASIEIIPSREGEPLGTGGAVAQAFDHVRGPRAWVLNGDSFCGADLAAVAQGTAAAPYDAWLVSVKVEDASRFGTLELDGSRVTRFVEKSGRSVAGWINAGIYILPRGLIAKGAASLERDHFPRWAAQGRLHAAGVRARFIDIGTPESFAVADAFFA